MGNVIRTVDYTPLTRRPSREEVAAFRAARRGTAGYAGSAATVVQVVVVTVMLLLFCGLLLGFSVLVGGLATTPAQQGSPFAVGAVVFPLFVIGVIVLIAIAGVRGAIGGGGRWARWLRLDAFATANGFVFSPKDNAPAYPGMIFGTGTSRQAIDHLSSASQRYLDYGNYRYVTGSGKNARTHHWGFLALQLDRALPHMLLDARANNGMFGASTLPASFDRDQVLSLEGDFDRYFTLYCPRQYERDALSVFTPDLMALLIDEAAPFDVEIVDSWMFLYSTTAFDLLQPTVHQRLLRIVDTVGSKTLTQTDRYRDERVGDFAANIIAPQGRRLRRGVSVAAIVVVVAFAVFWGLPFFGSILGFLGP